jgi:hypothetical protein
VAIWWSLLVGVAFDRKIVVPHSPRVCRDILYELACVGELPLPKPSPPSIKRERDDEPSPDSSGLSPSTSSPSPSIDEPRPIAGSRRVASKYASVSAPKIQVSSPEDATSHFQVPTNSQQLSLFQFYDQFGISTPNHANGLWDPSLFLPTTEASPAGSMAGLDPSMDTANLNFMDEAFYDQMSSIFSQPFGEVPDANAIVNGDTVGMFSNIPTGPM